MSASPDEQQAIYRRAAEMQVINHAMKQHNGCAPETCGGTGYDPCHLGSAIEDLLRRYSRIGGWQAATATEGAEMVKRLDLGQETGSLVVNHGAEIAECNNCAPLRASASVDRVDGSDLTTPCADCGAVEQGVTYPEEREHLRRQLEEIGQGVMQEWMRIVDLQPPADVAPTHPNFQARVRWQNSDGECIVGESQYGDEYGRFRLTVRAEDLGPVPPIGPENDPAQQFEQEPEPQHDPISGELIPASQDAELERQGREIAANHEWTPACPTCGGCCLAHEDGHAESFICDLHGLSEVRYGADGPLIRTEVVNIPAVPANAPLAPLWVPRTWADVRRGDTVRMPGTAVVAAITDRLWHPSEDPRGESWHVVSDGSIGQWAHTSDRVIRPGECVIVSPDIPGSERGRWMDPAAAVEIQLPDAQTLAGIEALGWENRLHTMDSAPNPGEG